MANLEEMSFKDRVFMLLNKVMEVVNNNDWPTTEGEQRADDPPCVIQQLVDSIKEDLQ